MIDSRTKLKVLHDDNSVFVDHSDSAADFSRDSFSVTLVAGEDYLYVGYRKPISDIYVELTTASTTNTDLSAEYYDGSSWTAITISDDSKAFQRSGFIHWDRPSDWASVAVNSITKYWIRFSVGTSTSAMSIKGINLIFTNDAALKHEFYEIDNTNIIPSGQSSHVMTHVASRNMIIQKLRNVGVIKTNSSSEYENIDQWDLFDIYEVRQAANFLALSKIFFNLSDAVDDHWWAKYKEYQDKFEEAFKLVKLSIDFDDDGTEDADEKKAPVITRRWVR